MLDVGARVGAVDGEGGYLVPNADVVRLPGQRTSNNAELPSWSYPDDGPFMA
jgi:hypothetical protein